MDADVKVVIIRMRGVPAMDISALRSLKNIHNICKKRGVTLVLSHVQEQPKNMMEKAGFVYHHNTVYHKFDGTPVECRSYLLTRKAFETA